MFDFLDLERFRPHVDSAKHLFCAYADRIVDTLSDISDGVHSEEFIETRRWYGPFTLVGGTPLEIVTVPAAEMWALEHVVVENGAGVIQVTNGPNGQVRFTRDVLTVDTFDPIDSIWPGGSSIYLASPAGLIATLCFRVRVVNPKRKQLRAGGVWERPSDKDNENTTPSHSTPLEFGQNVVGQRKGE